MLDDHQLKTFEAHKKYFINTLVFMLHGLHEDLLEALWLRAMEIYRTIGSDDLFKQKHLELYAHIETHINEFPSGTTLEEVIALINQLLMDVIVEVGHFESEAVEQQLLEASGILSKKI